MPTAVYAGSFDPVTLGHLWMIREGVRLFGDLTVAIGNNPAKRYTFDTETRCGFLKDATGAIPGVAVDVFENPSGGEKAWWSTPGRSGRTTSCWGSATSTTTASSGACGT